MQSIINFISHNYEWFFSGLGVFLLGNFISAIWWLFKRKKRKFVPDHTTQVDFLGKLREVRVRFAITADYDKISELATFYLGEGHGISTETIAEWSNVNHHIFRVAECREPSSQNGKWSFCGYYSAVPLARSTYDLLYRGKIQDFDITGASIQTFEDKDLENIYLMDMMTSRAKCHGRGCTNLVGTILLKDLVRYLAYLINQNENIKEIASVIASNEGRKLVKKFSFNKDSDFVNPFGWEFWKNDAQETINHLEIVSNFLDHGSFQEEYII